MEPIQIAVENADLDIALLLMKYGADVGQISDGTAKDGCKNIQQFLHVSAMSMTWICHGDTEIQLR
jgi:hypothetical protein